MKKGAMIKKNYELIILGIIFLIALVGLTIAANNHIVTITSGATSYVVKEDQQFTFNITINNTFADNVTWVNVTIDSTFAYKSGSNGTSASLNIQGGNINVTFTNTTTILSWVNTSSLGLPNTNTTFWFNATPSTPGTYTFTVNTANSTGSFVNTTTLTITVMEIHNVMATTGTRNFSTINEDTPALFNITLNSTIPIVAGNITNITITFPSTFSFIANSNRTELYTNSTKNLAIGTTFTNTSTSITWKNTTNGLITDVVNGSVSFNLSAQEPGDYVITVTTINSQDNGTQIQNFTVSVKDITDPEILSYNCSKTRFSEGESAGSCSCTATDNYDSSPSVTYGSPVTTNAGTYTITCTATDDATYNSSASLTYIVDASGGNVVSGGSGGGGTTYTMTYTEDTKEFSEISQISKELGAKNRIRIKINNIKHEIGVKELTAATATIEVSSTPQTAILSIGDTKKFDVTNDGYYDLSVTLSKIANSKASITLKSIYEKVTTETVVQEQEEQAVAEEKQTPQETITETMPETKSNAVILVIAIIIIILILVVIVYKIKSKKSKKRK